MENIKERYGDLTDKEYFEFLNEIKSSDEELEEECSELPELEEECSELPESEENARIEAYYGSNAWQKLGGKCFGKPSIIEMRKKTQKTNEAKREKTKRERIAIQRMAFNQTRVKLNDPIGSDNFKLLISMLTAEHTKAIEKYENYINKRLAALINPLIPRKIRACKMLYPESMKDHPGFLYRASEEYGEGQTFWAMPDIPYYFKQNTEQEELKKFVKNADYLISVDKAIAMYNTHVKVRAEKELKYASTFINKKIYSYFDLLRLNPFWFEILFNNLQNETNDL